MESRKALHSGFHPHQHPLSLIVAFCRKQHAARELDSDQLMSGRMPNPNRPVVASPRMAEYGPLKLKLNTPGLLRTFGSPCSLRVLKKILQGLEKVNLQVLINPRARLRSLDPKIKPPGPQKRSELSSQFQTYEKKKGSMVCRKRNQLRKSIVPKEYQERQQEAIIQRKTELTKSNKHLERWTG